ncbi:mannosyl phosphorylinositol ceramide synthase SUR1 [Uncinocarpus reesii 1704]|uniref:Mannosyl phosphorylinositol ceramide synthase SUR1 n=1 Tax=Uncinocarpus reesii (strain UAMH 1704) TaxID=336963 RepID=C4JNN2_UNCRE|nr:mannosyl phosphorylinositol ceramide synthase SUR1 [Uncinocarpus reesii 1704]EEP78185.1 mannosyl phosphorylinositol ceramide synthase SUR1 [Uncinocarpus reesii 1704]
MRRGALVFIIANIIVIAFLVNSVSTLLSLLFEDAADDAISRTELPAPNSTFIDQQEPLIPKIIHQTYKNESIPAIWLEAQQTCLERHPDYEYKLWTDDKAEEFIATQYPWFLDTFKNYPYPIQRADAIRYFVLAYYGGIYIDLDDGCNRRLDPLLVYPAWVRKTSPTGISNDIMGSVPQHPFFRRVIDSLQTYNRHWVLPYITVMYSTGPLFLSVIWKEYMAGRPTGSERVRVMMADEYNKHSWSFFTHHPGSSWHGKDARLIFWFFVFEDGWSLGPTHRPWIRARRYRRLLSMVGISTARYLLFEILPPVFSRPQPPIRRDLELSTFVFAVPQTWVIAGLPAATK